MAFQVKKINPLDLQPRKAIGVKLLFSPETIFVSTYDSKEAIKSNLVNFFLTGIGERYMNPRFGSSLRNLLFENMTPTSIDLISDNIRESLSLYFPRVLPTDIRLIPEPDQNLITFQMKYRIDETDISDELIIDIEQ